MTDGRIHSPCPCLVVLNQAFENPLRRQTLMPKYHNGRVADAECFAGVDLGIRVADRPLHKLHVVRHPITQAVFIAADVQAVLHCRPPGSGEERKRVYKTNGTWTIHRMTSMGYGMMTVVYGNQVWIVAITDEVK